VKQLGFAETLLLGGAFKGRFERILRMRLSETLFRCFAGQSAFLLALV
jgi:hypothetical protein